MAFAGPTQAPLARFDGSRERSADHLHGSFDGLDRIQTEAPAGPIIVRSGDLERTSPLARFLLSRTPEVDPDLARGLACLVEDVDLPGCDDVGKLTHVLPLFLVVEFREICLTVGLVAIGESIHRG